MVLTDKEIRELCNNQKPLISPFDENSLSSESYDLSIENVITIFKKEFKCIDISNQYDIDDMYEERTMKANGYILSPKEYALVHIRERVLLPDDITAHIRPRTRYTRLGLIVSDQHCNSSYEGNLKLGIFNATDYAIRIVPGVKIAQIVFEELKSIPTEEKLYRKKANAAYQNEEKFIGSVVEEKAKAIMNHILGVS